MKAISISLVLVSACVDVEASDLMQASTSVAAVDLTGTSLTVVQTTRSDVPVNYAIRGISTGDQGMNNITFQCENTNTRPGATNECFHGNVTCIPGQNCLAAKFGLSSTVPGVPPKGNSFVTSNGSVVMGDQGGDYTIKLNLPVYVGSLLSLGSDGQRDTSVVVNGKTPILASHCGMTIPQVIGGDFGWHFVAPKDATTCAIELVTPCNKLTPSCDIGAEQGSAMFYTDWHATTSAVLFTRIVPGATYHGSCKCHG